MTTGEPPSGDDVVAQTPRLTIRKLTVEDAPFILELLNDPLFLQFIGDRRVRTVADAEQYIRNVPLASYARYGFGHYLIEAKPAGEAAGICSLVKRDWLDDVDVGFALLPAFRRQGYAFEATAAVLAYARQQLGLQRLVAIAVPDNRSSIALLEKLGFQADRVVVPPGDTREVAVFSFGSSLP